MLTSMRAIMVNPSEAFLDERRKKEQDRRDEVWDGELHMVPPPTGFHQALSSTLVHVLFPHAERRGLTIIHDPGLFRREDDYRVPDLAVIEPKFLSKRGIDGHAELIVEILSPNDESRDKFPFYAACKVNEIWLIEPTTREVELYVLRKQSYFAVADQRGVLRSALLDLSLQTVAGPKLRLTWDEGTADV
jgi:Uma2 family endonuclease